MVKFYDSVDDSLLKFAVIFAMYNGKYIFCKHKQRDTLEIPGGHREDNEAIDDTAKRELYEETGAIDFEIEPVGVYSVTEKDNFNGAETFGMLYYAHNRSFETELHNEIEKIIITDKTPISWTYPTIQPEIFEYIDKMRWKYDKNQKA